MRLFDADAFFSEFRELDKEPYNNAPTVDPVKHGHWIKDECGASGALGLFVICSECHRNSMGDFPYCPYCGSKMDEVTE